MPASVSGSLGGDELGEHGCGAGWGRSNMSNSYPSSNPCRGVHVQAIAAKRIRADRAASPFPCVFRAVAFTAAADAGTDAGPATGAATVHGATIAT